MKGNTEKLRERALKKNKTLPLLKHYVLLVSHD